MPKPQKVSIVKHGCILWMTNDFSVVSRHLLLFINILINYNNIILIFWNLYQKLRIRQAEIKSLEKKTFYLSVSNSQSDYYFNY